MLPKLKKKSHITLNKSKTNHKIYHIHCIYDFNDLQHNIRKVSF